MDTPQIREQLPNLFRAYPNLALAESDADVIRICGNITVNRCANGFSLTKDYEIEITLSTEPNALPRIKETGGAINPSYPHRYSDGTLCLETDTAINIRYADGFNLLDWMDEYVEPYFFSYEFYSRYCEFPFGERPHGLEGLINTYQECFHEPDAEKVKNLMTYALSRKYRGHLLCPCGSGNKLRHCHGKYIFPFCEGGELHRILYNDVYCNKGRK